jgi:NAD(P)-dependent dehydrogenase (short-subunit alcohol dehydrogenase family)
VKDFKGKVALVTGAASGIGRATARALANAGATVVIADVDEAGARETIAMIEAEGGRAAFVRTDVTRPQDVKRMVAFCDEQFGRLDVLHNNAGINTGWPPYPDVERDRWEKTLAVNLWAVIAGTQAAVPLMRRGGGGAIVNTASLAGLISYRAEPIYAATKHAVVGFTRALAGLKDEANIRVNCICPGFVDTPLPRRRLQSMAPEERARWEETLARTPMLSAGEVAAAILNIIRDDSLAGEVIVLMYGQAPRAVPSAIGLPGS